MDYTDEQKVVIPSPREMERIDEIDKTKVFWTVILAVFIVGFVFVLGYWVGQQKAKANEFNTLIPNSNVDIGSLGDSPQNVPANNAPAPSPDTPQIGDNLSTLDRGIENESPPYKGNADTSVNPNPAQTASTPPLFQLSPAQSTPPVKVVHKTKRALSVSNKASKGKWALRLASVKSKKNVDSLKKELIHMGYSNINIRKIGVLYRISVLGFSTQAQVKNFQEAVKKRFHLTDTIVVKL